MLRFRGRSGWLRRGLSPTANRRQGMTSPRHVLGFLLSLVVADAAGGGVGAAGRPSVWPE